MDKVLAFGVGFAVGCLYASAKYERKASDLVDMAKGDILNAKEAAVNKVQEVFSTEKTDVQTEAKPEPVIAGEIER